VGPPRAGFVRNALGSLAVLVVVAVIAFGLPLLNRLLPAGRSVIDSRPYRVGAGVTVLPPPGARLDVTRTRPGDQRGTVLFVADGVRVVLVVSPFSGTLTQGADRLRKKITRSAGYQVTVGERPVHTDQGVPGVRGAYSSPGRVGEYAVFVADDLTVEVTASGPEDRLHRASAALDRSLRSLTFGGGL
jgi:hypothetical protein